MSSETYQNDTNQHITLEEMLSMRPADNGRVKAARDEMLELSRQAENTAKTAMKEVQP